jgi:SpoVK/Ycf46/Vps4 family AAA+-type ATPase
VTDGFVGAEIASLVPDALYEAFAEGKRPLTTEDLQRQAARVVPLAKTASEKITALREWAKGRARPASEPEAETTTAAVRSLDL